jgi:hypothetical protein
MKSDRLTCLSQYSSSGGLARCLSTVFWVEIIGRLPRARGDTSNKGIAQELSANVIPECCCQGSYLERVIKIPTYTGKINRLYLSAQSGSYPDPDKKSGGESAILYQILRLEKMGLRMTESLWGDPPLGKPSTGFSESDVGKPPDVECNAGRMLDELVSSELETTRLANDEIRNGCCLAMDIIGFQVCQN